MDNMLNGYASILLCSIFLCACSDRVEHVYELGTIQKCNAAETSCVVSNEHYIVELELGPKVVPLQNFPVNLSISGSDSTVTALDVVIDFQMVGMDMGLTRYRLTSSGGFWHGTVMLPICVSSRTDWLAIVEFTDQNRLYRAVFPFHADRN